MSLPPAGDAAGRAAAAAPDGAAFERAVFAEIHRRGDRWMVMFLGAHVALALALAPAHGTWGMAALVSGVALGTYLACWRLRPGSRLTRVVAGIALQAFCALHIHQMRGLAEMHFLYFTATTAMVIHQDWRALWPGVLLIIAQHTLFSALHNAGIHPGGQPFFEPGHVEPLRLGFHYGIALVQAALASYWAEVLRRRTLAAAVGHAEVERQRAALERANALLVAQARAMEEAGARLREEAAAHVAAERRFRAVQEGNPDGFMLLDSVRDADGRVVDFTYRYVNASGLRMAGRKAGDLVGRRMLEFDPSLRDEARFADYVAVVEHGAPLEREVMIARDGRRATYRIAGVRVDDGLALTVHDVTEHRAEAAARRAIEERLSLALESAEDALWDWHVDRDELYLSPRWFRMLGLEPGSLAPHPDTWLALVHAEDAELVSDALAAHMLGRTTLLTLEHRLRHRDGHYVWVRARGKAVAHEGGRPTRMVGTLVDVTEYKVVDEARRASEQLLETVIANAPFVLTLADVDGYVTFSGGGGLAALGQSAGAGIGRSLLDDLGRQRAREVSGGATTVGALARRALQGETVEGTVELPHGVTLDTVMLPLRDANGSVTGLLGFGVDVSERLRLAQQLRQAQKMEAVGQLAAGIAHDFNNLLTIVGGSVEMLRAELPAGDALHADVDEIGGAAQRAGTLVRQLLTFSRRQPVRPQPASIGAVVTGAERLLQRALGEDIALDIYAADGSALVLVDPGQVEQVLVNLAVNARDAIRTSRHGYERQGGTLSIETSVLTLSAEEARGWPTLRPGRHVCLRVSDTGHGMDAGTAARVFEPFFTTKEVGAGSGLGLAMVFGIVQQAGGAIRVESEPGRGATFTLLFPEAAVADMPAGAEAPPAAAAVASMTVLLVEDEPTVRLTTRRLLERMGHTVLDARHGVDAQALWEAHRDAIDVLVTDVRMPTMGGVELAHALRATRHALPVVFVSGYSDRELHLDRCPATAFLQKPFTRDDLDGALARVTQAVATGAA